MSDVVTAAVKALNDKLDGNGFDGVAKFEIEDEGAILIDETGARAGDDAADVTLSASADTFQDILTGNLDATSAFMTGRLKLDGDMGLAMRLGSVLSCCRMQTRHIGMIWLMGQHSGHATGFRQMMARNCACAIGNIKPHVELYSFFRGARNTSKNMVVLPKCWLNMDGMSWQSIGAVRGILTVPRTILCKDMWITLPNINRTLMH